MAEIIRTTWPDCTEKEMLSFYAENWARFVNDYCAENGITVGQFANLCCLETCTITRSISGKTVPPFRTLIKVALALEVTLDELIDRWV